MFHSSSAIICPYNVWAHGENSTIFCYFRTEAPSKVHVARTSHVQWLSIDYIALRFWIAYIWFTFIFWVNYSVFSWFTFNWIVKCEYTSLQLWNTNWFYFYCCLCLHLHIWNIEIFFCFWFLFCSFDFALALHPRFRSQPPSIFHISREMLAICMSLKLRWIAFNFPD